MPSRHTRSPFNRLKLASMAALVLAAGGASAACSSGDSAQSSASALADEASGLAQPAWATSSNFLGALDSGTPLSVQVHLTLRDVTAAQALLDSISDPDSPSYGDYLTTEQFNATYAPTTDDVALVRSHLESYGLQVTEVPSNNAYIAASGTANQVSAAFGTSLGTYQVGSETRYAPQGAVTLPAALSAHVSAVLGLSTPTRSRPSLAIPQSALKPQDTPPPNCSSYYGEKTSDSHPQYGSYVFPYPTVPCGGLEPAQLRHAYDVDTAQAKGMDGTGQTIALSEAWVPATLLTDAQQYFQAHDPSHPFDPASVTVTWGPGASQPNDGEWYLEEAMDLEAVHAFAPGAKIAYVAAQSDSDADQLAAENMIVANSLATIVSNSWEDDELDSSDQKAWDSLAIEAGLKGIGFFFASGDYGDNSQANNGTKSAPFPAALPGFTSIGGTALALGADGERVFELGWESSTASLSEPDGGVGNDWSPAPPGSYLAGSGGGRSKLYHQPRFQEGIVPANVSTHDGRAARVIPDVAMPADPFMGGMVVGYTQNGTYGDVYEGGTSLGTPLFAAMVGLVQQARGKVIGEANPLLYKASRSGAFTDIAPSDTKRAMDLDDAPVFAGDLWLVDYHGTGNTNATGVGFDSATGLGVPAGQAFFTALK